MTVIDKDALMRIIQTCDFHLPEKRPRLLFGPDARDTILQRATARERFLEQLDARCRKLLETSPDTVDQKVVQRYSAQATTMAQGYFLLGEAAFAQWAKRRVQTLFTLDTWMPPVHRSLKHCDHVMTNVAAHIAFTHDLLGDAYCENETQQVANGVRRLHFVPFLEATRNRQEWWTQEGCKSNWKIMNCGESGFAICEFVEYWPEAREALALAARGVVELLDVVPPEGDWPEGVGYWFGTLNMGLRYAIALRRLTGGAVNLLDHPALKVTGDYAMMLTTPGKRVFNFNDNADTLWGGGSEALAILAQESGRADWLHVARALRADTVTYLAFDDPARQSKPSERLVGEFPHTGVVSLRSGTTSQDTFVGFKCGPSDVGHSHLDAASFIVEAGGKLLVRDEGTWPYAHFLGFFDNNKLRWNWDNNGTVGHNTLLIDGKGQTWGQEYPGRILKVESGDGWDIVAGDASKTYPGLLSKFVRTLCFIHPDIVVVRDVVECEGERHAEWLIHPEGEIRSEDGTTVIESGSVRMTVTPFLPDGQYGWRVSDVVRTSTYEDSNTLKIEQRSVRYRSFAPFRAAESFEFLFVLHIRGDGPGKPWDFQGVAGDWELRLGAREISLRPDSDVLCLER